MLLFGILIVLLLLGILAVVVLLVRILAGWDIGYAVVS